MKENVIVFSVGVLIVCMAVSILVVTIGAMANPDIRRWLTGGDKKKE